MYIAFAKLYYSQSSAAYFTVSSVPECHDRQYPSGQRGKITSHRYKCHCLYTFTFYSRTPLIEMLKQDTFYHIHYKCLWRSSAISLIDHFRCGGGDDPSGQLHQRDSESQWGVQLPLWHHPSREFLHTTGWPLVCSTSVCLYRHTIISPWMGSPTVSSMLYIRYSNSIILFMQAGLSLCVSQLRYHGEVMWLNPSEKHRAGKTSWKKGQGPQTTCFGMWMFTFYCCNTCVLTWSISHILHPFSVCINYCVGLCGEKMEEKS